MRKFQPKRLDVSETCRTFAALINILNLIVMETTKRKRTREEVRAAVRETIRRKKEWIEKTNKEFEMIRNGELKVEDIYVFK